MKFIYSLLVVVLLSACGTATNLGNPAKEPVQNVAQDESSNENFHFQLVSEKEQYHVGDKLEIRAVLTYKGEQQSVDIGHGGSWVWLNTTNLTEDYRFGTAMNEPYIITKMQKDVPIVQTYRFSGGAYDSHMDGQPFSDKIYMQMAEMNFPPGQYEIYGRTDFVIEGSGGQKQLLEARIIFEVIEQTAAEK